MNNAHIIKLLMATAIAVAATPSFAAGVIENGKSVSKKCRSCHTFEKGEKNKLGPNLYKIIGRRAGQADGYDYSEAMMSSGITWDEKTLIEYISKPKEFVKETKMTFRGIQDPKKKRDLLAYFRSLVKN